MGYSRPIAVLTGIIALIVVLLILSNVDAERRIREGALEGVEQQSLRVSNSLGDFVAERQNDLIELAQFDAVPENGELSQRDVDCLERQIRYLKKSARLFEEPIYYGIAVFDARGRKIAGFEPEGCKSQPRMDPSASVAFCDINQKGFLIFSVPGISPCQKRLYFFAWVPVDILYRHFFEWKGPAKQTQGYLADVTMAHLYPTAGSRFLTEDLFSSIAGVRRTSAESGFVIGVNARLPQDLRPEKIVAAGTRIRNTPFYVLMVDRASGVFSRTVPAWIFLSVLLLSGLLFIAVTQFIRGHSRAIELKGRLDETLRNEAAVQEMNRVLFNETQERKLAQENLQKTCQQLDASIKATLNVITHICEMRDPYTVGHQRAVAGLCEAIAKRMENPQVDLGILKQAAMVHDVGKIRIPAELLSKPGKLLPQEKEIMEFHPEWGYEILSQAAFHRSVAEIVRQHHERLDGSGYPAHLNESDISMEARIIAVADVMEAMASDRPYRPSLGVEKALEEIIRWKGIRFDAKVVDACVDVFKKDGYCFGKAP